MQVPLEICTSGPHFKTPKGEAEYIAAYETTLTLWAIPYEFLEVPTQWGRTHIIACGPKDAPPLILLHGMKNFRLHPHIRVFPTVFNDDELRQIKAHTLLLIGAEEVICNPEEAVNRAKQLIQNVEAEVIPNAGHGLPMEQPELVNERILGFLNQEQGVV